MLAITNPRFLLLSLVLLLLLHTPTTSTPVQTLPSRATTTTTFNPSISIRKTSAFRSKNKNLRDIDIGDEADNVVNDISDETGLSTGVIVAIAVGAAAFLILMIILCCCCCCF